MKGTVLMEAANKILNPTPTFVAPRKVNHASSYIKIIMKD
jgi:hypothetical protein